MNHFLFLYYQSENQTQARNVAAFHKMPRRGWSSGRAIASMNIFSVPVGEVVKGIVIGAGSRCHEFNRLASKSVTVSPTARHLCDISSELCCPGPGAAEMDPATRHTLRRNTARIIKV